MAFSLMRQYLRRSKVKTQAFVCPIQHEILPLRLNSSFTWHCVLTRHLDFVHEWLSGVASRAGFLRMDMSVIPPISMLMQEDWQFWSQVKPGCIERHCLIYPRAEEEVLCPGIYTQGLGLISNIADLHSRQCFQGKLIIFSECLIAEMSVWFQ